MANPDHLALLNQSTSVWNEWRKEKRSIIVDPSGADLSEAKLSKANLCDANLHKTDLSGADLTAAYLSRSYLGGADLSGAYLAGANLCGTDLSGADFSDTLIYETIFADVNLAEAKNLDACHHSGPSTLDFRTLQKSGSLPLVFLRGCGLSERLIDFLPSLLTQPIQLYSRIQFYSCLANSTHKCNTQQIIDIK
jgi:hypothetical protein